MTSRVGLKKVDYFVFGIGFGASLVLLGWALRQFGPGLRFRNADSGRNVLSAEEMLIRHDWARFCMSLGGLLSVAGAVVLLTTIVTLLIRPSDRAGSIVSGALFVVVLAGVAAWIGLFLSQHQGLGFRREAPSQVSSTKRPARALAQQDEYSTEEELDEKPLAARQAIPETHSQPVHQNRVRVRPTVRPVTPAIHADTESDDDPADRAEQNDSESGAVSDALTAESTATTPAAHENTSTQNFRGVRFTRPQRHEGEKSSDSEPVASPSTASDEQDADSEGPATEPIADESTSPEPTSQGAEDTGGDDIVSSVTVRESPSDDIPVEQTTPPTEDKDERVSSADAYMQQDVALANLRLRRVNRSIHKDL